jgi:hypothetical protein
MQHILSDAIAILMVGSLVYFFVGFVLMAGSKKSSDALEGAEKDFLELVELVETAIDVQVEKVVPCDRASLCKLACRLGIARAWNRKSMDLVRMLREDFGYNRLIVQRQEIS